jgi:chemotaxis methyl-accepting protein methylase
MNQLNKFLIIRVSQILLICLIVITIGKDYPVITYLIYNSIGIIILLFAFYRQTTTINLDTRTKNYFTYSSLLFASADIIVFVILNILICNILIAVITSKIFRFLIEGIYYSNSTFSSAGNFGFISLYPLNIVIEVRWFFKKLLGRIGQQYVKDSAFTQKTLINTSYLFRDMKDYSEILKKYYEKNNKTIHILVAGCATGQEAYSISAFCIKSKIPVSITAFDFSQQAITKAEIGEFNLSVEKALIMRSNEKIALDHLELFKDLFQIKGNIATARFEIKKSIKFAVQDITSINYKSEFDFVFARKMLYYIPKRKIGVAIQNLKDALVQENYPDNLIVDNYARNLYNSYF